MGCASSLSDKLSTTVVVDCYGSSWQLRGLEYSFLRLLWAILTHREHCLQKDVGPDHEGMKKKVSQGCFHASFSFLRGQESMRLLPLTARSVEGFIQLCWKVANKTVQCCLTSFSLECKFFFFYKPFISSGCLSQLCRSNLALLVKIFAFLALSVCCSVPKVSWSFLLSPINVAESGIHQLKWWTLEKVCMLSSAFLCTQVPCSLLHSQSSGLFFHQLKCFYSDELHTIQAGINNFFTIC